MTEDRERPKDPGSEESLEAEDEAKAAIHKSVEANTGYEPDFEKAQDPGRRLDLNTASEDELEQLPGIGPGLAAEIVADRMERGSFREAAEVTRVPGVSADLYDGFADRVTVGSDLPEAEFAVEESVILPREATEAPDEAPPVSFEEPEPGEEIPAAGERLEDDDVWAEDEGLADEEFTAEQKERLDEEVLVQEEALAAGQPLPAREAPPPPPPPRPLREVTPPAGRGVGWASLLLVGLLSAVAGALLALLVLFLLNGTLDVQRAAERRLQGEVFRLEGDMEAVRAQARSVEERMAGVEGLAGQVEAAQGQIRDLGTSVDSLRTDVGTATQRIEDMQMTLAGLSDDMVNVQEGVTALGTQLGDMEARLGTMAGELAEAQEAVTRFDAFLAGLQALLSETTGTSGPATDVPALQTMTPFPSPAEGTAPASTPRPGVTVIPLVTATPTTP
jgi:competence ComEA-like helix-hairpin-helix protein